MRLIMTQSMLLTLASFALAYVLRDLMAPGFPRTLAFVAPETAVTLVVMLVGGMLASLMAVWHALPHAGAAGARAEMTPVAFGASSRRRRWTRRAVHGVRWAPPPVHAWWRAWSD
ncbi:MAG: hypothetical protein IPP50_19960 [Piscinibacter sp.]|nr:hypothetical protein [Piscinibacter sp.]